LLAHDAEIAAAGITTVFDALGVGDADESALRGKEMSGVLASLARAMSERVLRADHQLHIRCEVPAHNTIELFEPFIDHPLVRLLSLMDHTPGQRQWTNIDHARTYWTGKKGWTTEKFERHMEEAPVRQRRYADAHRWHFINYARERSIPLASHDDTTVGHVAEALAVGMAVSEFPTTVAAARAAHAAGLAVVMGAPNVVRGGSHSGNVAAIELAQLKLLDVLSSDYVPGSLLHAAFMIHASGGFTLPAAIATVSANPARAVGLEDRGAIDVGKRADLVHVGVIDGHPVVRGVWRGGIRVN
jgi:alpha-D-ribose 1-methylphosphonate 5-triphosphate diphosphatase